uniref:Uncharacterized protein n=1 Tax=Mus musculus TaxID=10090 RepID=Q3TRV2_MOUSE|nr:unnamed protein product [Mus musculus]
MSVEAWQIKRMTPAWWKTIGMLDDVETGVPSMPLRGSTIKIIVFSFFFFLITKTITLKFYV